MVIAQYFAFVKDLRIVFCFLDFYEIGEPRKMQQLVENAISGWVMVR